MRDCGFQAGQRVTGAIARGVEEGWSEMGKKILRPPRVRPCVAVCAARIFMRYITYSSK